MTWCIPGSKSKSSEAVESEKANKLFSAVDIVGCMEKRFARLDKKNNNFVTAHDIAEYWKEASKSVWGKVNGADSRLVAAEAKRICERLDLDGDGKVSFEEFAHFLLMRSSLPKQLASFNEVLKEIAFTRSDPQLLQRLVTAFRQADKEGAGVIPVATLHSIIIEVVPGSEVSKAASELTGTVNYGEYVMLMLGRKPQPVKLLYYDISGKATKALARLLFGRPIEGIWHTSVVAFGKEWWFGGKLFRSEVESTPFGKPVKEISLGTTYLTHVELFSHITEELATKYTPDTYDVIKRNCNHFTNEVSTFLCGSGIPKDIIDMPKQLLSGGIAYLLRPFLNSWLGGFDSDAAPTGENDETEKLMLAVAMSLVHKGQLVDGGMADWVKDRKSIPVQILTLNLTTKTATLRYLTDGKFANAEKIPISQLRPIKQSSITDEHTMFSTMIAVESDSYRSAVNRSFRQNPSIAASMHGDFIKYLAADPNQSVIHPAAGSSQRSSQCGCCVPQRSNIST
jgi:PPPDE putative peptidase domain/EF-hand domain pair